jgi:membrane protein implicated in regulation of membrane protease activity
MNMLFRFLSHSSIQTRILSLFSSGILFMVGRFMGFLSWKALLLGALLGSVLGILFWYETRTPLYRGRRYPITATQKVGHGALVFLYAIFIGCVLDWMLKRPSPTWTTEFLRHSLDGLIGFVAAFTVAQIVRLWHYLLHGGVLDRFIWRERQTGREGMIGRVGIVRERLAPEGKIFIRGELWDAVAEGSDPAEVGSRVVTEKMVGLRLHVRPLSD